MIVCIGHRDAASAMRCDKSAHYNDMSAAVDKIHRIQDQSATKLAFYCRSAIDHFVAEISIFVSVTSRTESKRADHQWICILGNNGYAESRILF